MLPSKRQPRGIKSAGHWKSASTSLGIRPPPSQDVKQWHAKCTPDSCSNSSGLGCGIHLADGAMCTCGEWMSRQALAWIGFHVGELLTGRGIPRCDDCVYHQTVLCRATSSRTACGKLGVGSLCSELLSQFSPAKTPVHLARQPTLYVLGPRSPHHQLLLTGQWPSWEERGDLKIPAGTVYLPRGRSPGRSPVRLAPIPPQGNFRTPTAPSGPQRSKTLEGFS
jgi:hypothetical protein